MSQTSEKIHNFNFLSQDLSIEYNFFKRDGKFNQEMEFEKKDMIHPTMQMMK